MRLGCQAPAFGGPPQSEFKTTIEHARMVHCKGVEACGYAPFFQEWLLFDPYSGELWNKLESAPQGSFYLDAMLDIMQGRLDMVLDEIHPSHWRISHSGTEFPSSAEAIQEAFLMSADLPGMRIKVWAEEELRWLTALQGGKVTERPLAAMTSLLVAGHQELDPEKFQLTGWSDSLGWCIARSEPPTLRRAQPDARGAD